MLFRSPQIEFVGMAYQPVQPAEGVAPEPELQAGEGFVIRPLDDSANELLFRLRYSDAGGDLQFFVIRDRDSLLLTEVTPTAPEVDRDGDGEPDTVDTPDYFSGTAGEVDLPNVVFESTMVGPHRLEIWAEDSHGSRSEKVAFTVQVVL